jgi:hypothetical protein
MGVNRDTIRMKWHVEKVVPPGLSHGNSYLFLPKGGHSGALRCLAVLAVGLRLCSSAPTEAEGLFC